jgi:pimeloyl-ACP methyl ester carboxylesterase
MSDCDVFQIPVGPGSMHVERYGYGGPAVVLLHGFATSSFLWRHVGPRIALRKRTAIAMDLFGFGESDRPFAGDYGVTAQSEYVDNALTAMRHAKATIVGVDIGAVIAMRLAFDRPDRVERLILVSPSSWQELPGAEIRELQRDSARYALSLTRGLFGAWQLFADFLVQSVGDPSHMPPRLVGRYLAPYLGRDGLNHLLTLARALEFDDLDDLELDEITHPVAVVRGKRDRQSDLAYAEELCRSLPDARLIEPPEAGRLVPEDDRDALVEVIASDWPAAVAR